MNDIDWKYRNVLLAVRDCGTPVRTRNAAVRRVFAHSARFRKTPLVCVRKTAWRNCLREWEFFMSGRNNLDSLHPSVRHWWEPFAGATGNLPLSYSQQFRASAGWRGQIDQINYLIDGIRDHPASRRNVITTWNTCDMASGIVNPTTCHGTVIQAFVEPADDALHLVTYQRSADVVCGLPHNWLQYWAFLLWLAHRGGRKAGSLNWVGGDVHVYDVHEPIVAEILAAGPDPDPPELVYTPSSDEFLASDFTLDRPYRPKVLTRAEMVV